MFDVPGVHNGMLIIVFGGHRLITTERGTPTLGKVASADGDLNDAIRSYVRTYVLWHGRQQAAETFGISRHTLWRFLERGHVGRAVPCAVIDAVGGSARAIEAATRELAAGRPVRRRDPAPRPLPKELEDTLLLVCAAPLATVGELARFSRVPATTLRERLGKLVNKGLVDSVAHRLGVLGPHPQRRYFPTEQGIDAGGIAEQGRETFLREYPVSRRWFQLLVERLDAIAVLYYVAALVADADPHETPLRVDHYRQGPYDMLITLSKGRSVGLLRQGSTLPSANLRYRLRSMENLPSKQRTTVTLALTHSDQATRRAVRTLGHPMQHRTTFVVTEGELLAGDHKGVVWQQCGAGMGDNPPVKVVPDVPLNAIVALAGRLVEISEADRRRYGFRKPRNPTPDPEALYPSHRRATMPNPAQQLESALSVQLNRAEKDALDLLAAWPLCTTEQLARLMGGVTRRRANQVLQSLTGRGLIRTDNQRHVLTREGLTYLARRDRAALRMILGRWSARQRRPRNGKGRGYAGSALRAIASQMEHHDALTGFAAALTAEAARSQDYGVLDLLPTSRSAIGYYYFGTNYVVHPDASFTLDLRNGYRYCLLEFERRATTPKRVRARLENYRRYFASGWPERDHGGQLPLVLFVFQTPDAEDAFLGVIARSNRIPLCSSNLQTLTERGVLSDVWRLPPPNPADRLPLHRLDKVQFCPPGRSPHFL